LAFSRGSRHLFVLVSCIALGDMAACRQITSRCTGADKWDNKVDADTDSEVDVASEETTPTTLSEADDNSSDDNTESDVQDVPEEHEPVHQQLGPGLYHDDIDEVTPPQHHTSQASALGGAQVATAPAEHEDERGPDADGRCEASSSSKSADPEGVKFTKEQTLFVFDWDDTILPSTWVQREGLRLDDGAVVNAAQRERLAELAPIVAETLRLAKLHGTVVLVTNAERGWIELSCRKFLPTIAPLLENVRLVSARTTYEGPRAPSPLDWKVHAFDTEIARMYGRAGLLDASKVKHIFSLGDGAHEREALLRTTNALPNCRSKSLKFAERPDISQIIKQHSLIAGCFDTLLHHDANLDLCIRCS